MSAAVPPRPPSVERLVAAAGAAAAAGRERTAVVAAAREVVAEERARLRAGAGEPSSIERLAAHLAERLERLDAPSAPPRVVNGSGVLLHTNLGRAPWAAAAVRAASAAAAGYGFVELDPASGRRGRRGGSVEEHLRALTGAEAALVATNGAAALALAVGLAGRRGVVVSRGELVEIGGGVRIPEIVRRAGARLVEVGTTNRTRPEDFEAVLAEGRARLVLRVHPSNFTMAGFVEVADHAAVAAAAHRHGAFVVDDIGSGALLDTAAYGLAHEPMPAERLAAGSDLVLFSADKLLGGPQAGLVVGREDLVDRLRRDPLARAVRPDKTILAALEATLALYRAGRATEIPVWRAIATPVDALRARAEALATAVGAPAAAIATEATLGGGSLPGETLPSWGVAVDGPAPDRLAARLRTGEPALLARVADGRVVVDLRAVEPEDDRVVAELLAAALAGDPGGR